MTPHALEQASREKRTAVLGSVGSAVVLVSLKVVLSVVTGSLGILSKALHSSLDLVAAVITYLSIRVTGRAQLALRGIRLRRSSLYSSGFGFCGSA
jgi:divalent metal cation (Fe/Co/Zn/Cd) transporter